MKVSNRLNNYNEVEQASFCNAVSRREIIKRGAQAATAAALYYGGVRNLGARDSLSAGELLKPGTKLTALREVSPVESSSDELILRRDPAERFVVISSRELDPKIAKALGNPMITTAVLRKIDPAGKPIDGVRPYESFVTRVPLLIPTPNPTDTFDWGTILVLVHHLPDPTERKEYKESSLFAAGGSGT